MKTNKQPSNRMKESKKLSLRLYRVHLPRFHFYGLKELCTSWISALCLGCEPNNFEVGIPELSSEDY
jgi:hypothetical protein